MDASNDAVRVAFIVNPIGRLSLLLGGPCIARFFEFVPREEQGPTRDLWIRWETSKKCGEEYVELVFVARTRRPRRPAAPDETGREQNRKQSGAVVRFKRARSYYAEVSRDSIAGGLRVARPQSERRRHKPGCWSIAWVCGIAVLRLGQDGGALRTVRAGKEGVTVLRFVLTPGVCGVSGVGLMILWTASGLRSTGSSIRTLD